MQVKERLRINTGVIALSAIAVVVVLAVAVQRVNKAIEQNGIANALTAAQFERLMLREDYLRTGSIRAQEQTRAKYRQVSDILKRASAVFTDS
ncbi:MAG TPA: hypothetical protein VK445_07070, partial [Dissulfurispiraceae bacterium]|nr:hypothetical protein [Dissulfurispiraceae bacterium]